MRQVMDSQITDNDALGTDGGAIHSVDVRLINVRDSIMTGNSAGQSGGAFSLKSLEEASSFVSRTLGTTFFFSCTWLRLT